MFTEHLSPGSAGSALAAVFSAEVSTCDAILFMLATSLSQDLYKRFVNPAVSDAQLLCVARAAVARRRRARRGAGDRSSAIGDRRAEHLLFAPRRGLFVPILGGLFSTRAGSREALAAIAAGVLVRVALRVFNAGRGVGILDPTLLGTLRRCGRILRLPRTAVAASRLSGRGSVP